MALSAIERAGTAANFNRKSTSDLIAALAGVNRTIEFAKHEQFNGTLAIATELREIIVEIIAERA